MAFKINELSGKLGEIIDKLGVTLGCALIEEIKKIISYGHKLVSIIFLN
ncbi:hypothetical protein [Sporanaerobium hydrogeniformans]|nr:hypothetical protein [Sporanaerobium hydrogeniformans]